MERSFKICVCLLASFAYKLQGINCVTYATCKDSTGVGLHFCTYMYRTECCTSWYVNCCTSPTSLKSCYDHVYITTHWCSDSSSSYCCRSKGQCCDSIHYEIDESNADVNGAISAGVIGSIVFLLLIIVAPIVACGAYSATGADRNDTTDNSNFVQPIHDPFGQQNQAYNQPTSGYNQSMNPLYNQPSPDNSHSSPVYASQPSAMDPPPPYSAPKPSAMGPPPPYSAPKPSTMAPPPSYQPHPDYSRPTIASTSTNQSVVTPTSVSVYI